MMTKEIAMLLAVDAAKRSPCAKSKRGVVIWCPINSMFAIGFNHPPDGFRCDDSDACREHCNKLCLHAEQEALMAARGRSVFRSSPRVLHLLHVKVDADGNAVPSGPPSCWQCSRLIVDCLHIDTVWLLEDEGLRSYTPHEFHVRTLEYCQLPVFKDPP